MTIQLTSNTEFSGPGDAESAVMVLCRVNARDAVELGLIMRTIEWRLLDTGGLKWRHGHKALLLLRALLVNGPEVKY